MSGKNFDIIIIGGGVVGCSVARTLSIKHPKLKIILVEKEKELGTHQSSRNSGVVHAGYNQKPGTLKAKFVVEGSRRLRQFCKERKIPLVEDGILVVARNHNEINTLKELLKRGTANGARVELIDEKQVREVEPYAEGCAGLFAPEGASFDSNSYVLALAEDAKKIGAVISLSEQVTSFSENYSDVIVNTNRRKLGGGVVINAAGVYADRLAHFLGVGEGYQIIPFKGQYYELVPEKRSWVHSHIYPPANLNFPFLGVHLSKNYNGHVKVGPGAVLALSRECYDLSKCNLLDLLRTFCYPGLWRMFASQEFRSLMKKEWKKSFFKRAVLNEARQLVPRLKIRDIIRGICGIRAQLVSKDGRLVDDLIIEETPKSIHILNAVSPALTCSLPFADHIASLVEKKL